MSSFSKILLTVLNAGILIFGLYHIFAAEDLSEGSSLSVCLRESSASVQRLGAFCSVVAAVGIAGTWSDLRALQYIYAFALLFWAAAAAIFCVFIWAVMPKVGADDLFYKVGENGTWLPEYSTVGQKMIANGRDFTAAKDCFNRIDICRIMRNQTEEQKVSYLDIGCCNPPNRCGMVQNSTGAWVMAEYGLNSKDDECQMWAKVNKDCFKCDSCKAAYMANYQRQWEDSTSSRVQSMLVLLAASALTYHTFIHELYRGDYKDQKKGKLDSNNV